MPSSVRPASARPAPLQPAPKPAQPKTRAGQRLEVGGYQIGEEADINLFGHPDIRY